MNQLRNEAHTKHYQAQLHHTILHKDHYSYIFSRISFLPDILKGILELHTLHH